ncbi:tetratricopeptide repeat protein [Candidatus Parcubacteria bacterium]|nr:tetratricopeptide repeat protein [Candidatus Parcubacteria bacterium]
MHSSYKVSFITLLVVVFLLPLFFLPTALAPLGVAKVILLTLGAVVGLIAFLISALRSGGIALPRAYVLWGVVALPLVYLLAAFGSSVPGVSLFGYSFETGTFAFVLLGSIFFLLSALTVTDTGRLLRVYGAFFLSAVLLLVFALVKLATGGNTFVFGAFPDATASPIGAWTDYAVGFALLSIICIFALEMLTLRKSWRAIVYIIFLLSIFLVAVLNFSTAWYITLGVSLITAVYFLTVERSTVEARSTWKLSRLVPVGILLALSLIFTINPTFLSEGSLGAALSNKFHIVTSDVRPSFSSTISVARRVLAKEALLGSGPNTFDQDWLLYKPSAINTTTFWNVAFPAGVGFIPTMLATTGLLGGLMWLGFLLALLILGARSLRNISKNSERFAIVSSFVGALFLWAAAFFYVPSAALLVLAFIFTGLFVASAATGGIIASRTLHFRSSPALNFASVLVIIIIGIGSLSLALVSYQKVASIFHFERALALSRVVGSSADKIESELDRAISLSPADIYYGSLSELSFARAQGILQNPTTTPEATQTAFQAVFQKSIAAADNATKVNPGNYQNWVRLGRVYAALVPKPLAVAGAYESARGAYEAAQKLSPENPEPSLLMARLEIDHGNAAEARTHIQSAIQKKQDYVDAYFLLTQLDVQENNVAEAIQAAEATAILSPNNAGVFFELGLLKYTTQDYLGAAQALKRAVEIVPEYANAKYFLGLSLDKLGAHEEAIREFKDLAASNPDNADVASILANLEAGHDAFYKAPASAKKPEKRSTPPIKSTATQE